MRRVFKQTSDGRLERMFETRSDAWEAVGLAFETNQKVVRRARKQAAVLVPLLIGVLIVWANRHHVLGQHRVPDHRSGHWSYSAWETPLQIATVLAVGAVGWALARDVGRAAGPTFFRRMDPGTAGTVGFLIRLGTIVISTMVALRVAGIQPQTLAVGGAFTAVIFGLAAQQTLGNLIAGMVLLSARPFRVGELIRLQAGAVGGSVEGIVSSLGLLYTTLAAGADRILIPNNVVLAAAVVPLREPEPVDVKVRLPSHMRMSQLQEILDEKVSTPTRGARASVVLEEIDGDDVVVRVHATPEHAADGAKLADEIIAVLSEVTGEHALTTE
jgi:small-conductance mechanosensitive channel